MAVLRVYETEAMVTAKILAALWIAWLFYWLLAAIGAKRTQWQEKLGPGLIHRLPLTLAFLLLALPRFAPALLRQRFLPFHPLLGGAGIALTALGLAVAVWARVHLGRNWSAIVTVKEDHALIRSGPYRLMRHPIYSGVLLALLGTALALGERRDLIALVLAFVALLYKSAIEEERMAATFPDYDDYRRRTARLVPFVF
jgi:protein-S-isoprenylcysteine O-methyltransferase Ste14